MYGFGHIRRSNTLACALKQRGYSVRFSAVSKNGNRLLPKFSSTELRPTIYILDIPYEIKPWIMKSKAQGLPIVALDYFGEAQPTLTISIYEHRSPPPEGNRVHGLEYAIVRPEIAEIDSVFHEQNVIVMIGGADINHIGETIATILVDAGQNVRLIQGPASKEDYTIKTLGIEVLRAPKNLAAYMAGCAWAVTNGGSSMMEMMCLGKAVHVIPQTTAEQHLAQLVFDQGAILGIGLDTLSVPSPEKIIEVGHRASLLVDGRGADRIIDLVEEVANEYK